jgi:DNA-directed RNA polymerase specialized sigma24 family protein
MSDEQGASVEDPLGDLIRSESPEQIARVLFPHVRRIARSVLVGRDPHLIETAAADAVMAVCRYRSGFRGQSKASTWVHTITRREAIRHARQESKRTAVMVSCNDEFDRGCPADVPTADPPLFSAREAMEMLRELVPNPAWRQIWFLWNTPGTPRSREEVALLTGYTPASVGVILSRVRSRLNRVLPAMGESL